MIFGSNHGVSRLKHFVVREGRLQLSRLGRLADSPDEQSRKRREIFEEVYATGKWGSRAGEAFYSGAGSRGDSVVEYVRRVSDFIADLEIELGRPAVVVDIGCGDFEVGRAMLELLPETRYIGCDVVRPLVDYNNRHYKSERASFRVLDIVAQVPPEADIYLVRQVFQHLSNADIIAALANLAGKNAIVTEGQPEFPKGPANPDKAPGAGIRFHWSTGIGRGVELNLAPFNLNTKELFRVPSPPHEVLVTWLLSQAQP